MVKPRRTLERLYRLAISDMDLSLRYAAAREMQAIRAVEKPEKDIPASIIRGLWYRSQRGKVVHR